MLQYSVFLQDTLAFCKLMNINTTLVKRVFLCVCFFAIVYSTLTKTSIYSASCEFSNTLISLMVLKTRPDRPVQPGTSAQSGSVLWKNRKNGKIGQKPKTTGSTIKIANWTG